MPVPSRFSTTSVKGLPVAVDPPILGKKSVEFCPHALQQMKIRGVKQQQVIDTLRNPTITGLRTAPGRRRVRRQISKGKELDVIFALKPDRIVVITSFFR